MPPSPTLAPVLRPRFARLGPAIVGIVLALGACSSQSAPSSAPTSPTPAATPSPERPSPSTAAPSDPTAHPSATRSTPTPSGQAEEALESALETATEQAIRASLTEAGITMSAGPNCNADLKMDRQARSAAGTETCSGTTTKGLAVKGNFSGSITSTGSCDGTLVVKVGGQTVVNESLTTCTVS